jgi:hypothetical protein
MCQIEAAGLPACKLGGYQMRKIAVLVAVAAAVAAPSAAFAAKKKAATPAVYDTTAANQNESGWRFFRDGVWNLGLRGPAWSKQAAK